MANADEIESLYTALSYEHSEELEIQIEQDEQQQAQPQPVETPEKKRLKRDIQREALSRLEDAARTEEDFRQVTEWWDRLDANRERKERYHEICRSGDDVPLDYGAAKDALRIPDTMNSVLVKQMQKGDFLDVIFNCPYDIHELVTEEYLSQILRKLSEDQKEILFLHAIRQYSARRIGEIRKQSDRNIRKVRATLFRQIYKKLLITLTDKEKKHLPMTSEERKFLSYMKKAALDGSKNG